MRQDKTAKVMVLCGFLGAGKTTLLSGLLRNPPENEKVAVIINEFAALGIDGKLVRSDGVEVKELSNGCVCCTKGAELGRTIRQLAEDHGPSLIIVEASGVASMESFMEIVSKSGSEVGGVVVVVDAKRFESCAGFGPVARKQIEMASAVVISKSDIASLKSVEEIKVAAASMNPGAKILVKGKGDLSVDDLSGTVPKISSENSGALHRIMKSIFPAAFLDGSSRHLRKSGMGSLAFRTACPISRNKFELFAQQMPRYVYRAKGMVNFKGEPTQTFNYASGLMSFEPSSEQRGNSDIVLIGKMSLARKASLMLELSSLKQGRNRLGETLFNIHNFIKAL